MKPEESMLQIRHAHKYYNRGRSNELHVMNDVDLSLPAAGMVAIFGQSGCGKTTLLNAIGGLDSIAEGSIELFGQNIAHDTDTLRNRYIGYIFQNYNLNVNETVFENVADALRLCGITDEAVISERVLASLANVGLEKYKKRTPDTLSGGQQQRVSIARALVKNPAVILADEPTGNLDEANTILVMDILKEISKTHLVLLVTHEVNLVDYYCDRVIRIVDGRIVEDRQNTGANGYVARDKNDIYLGELEKHEESFPGGTLTCYGNAEEPIKLRLVTSGGHTYLVCDTPNVRVLDENSEIKLREGVFRTEARSENGPTAGGHPLDMSALTPIEGSHFGRLFHWKNALVSAWHDNFSGKQKKGTILLRVTMALLAVVVVFTAAVSAVNIQTMVEMYEQQDRNLFFVQLESGKEYPELNQPSAASGIDATWLTGSEVMFASEKIVLHTAQFMTATAPVVEGTGHVADISHFRGLPAVAGTAALTETNDVLITTALGDEIIKSSTAGYIDSYEDLVGLVGELSYASSNVRIAGVVRSDEKLLLMDSLSFAQRVHTNTEGLTAQAGVHAASLQGLWKEPVQPGELVVLNGKMEPDETVRIFGRDFRVTHVDRSATYHGVADYYRYYLERTGKTIPDVETYIASGGIEEAAASGGVAKTRRQLQIEWMFEVFPQGETFREFCTILVENYVPWAGMETVTPELWLYAKTGNMIAYLTLLSWLAGEPTYMEKGSSTYPMMPFGTEQSAYAEWLVHEKTGEWPAEPVNDPEDLRVSEEEARKLYQDVTAYNNYLNERYSQGAAPVQYVVSDADYIALAGSVGTYDKRLDVYAFTVSKDYWENKMYYQNHMVVHASDPEAAQAYLANLYGENLVSPASILQEQYEENRGVLIVGVTIILVVLGLMCLCVFFIMRSSFMHRVREVGIYRAIGVTRKNLIFRFMVETLLLVSMTILIGFLLASLLIVYLSGGVLLGKMFYFPFWLAACLLLVLYGASVLFGILPVLTLLRRTPSEILSKYDI